MGVGDFLPTLYKAGKVRNTELSAWSFQRALEAWRHQDMNSDIIER